MPRNSGQESRTARRSKGQHSGRGKGRDTRGPYAPYPKSGRLTRGVKGWCDLVLRDASLLSMRSITQKEPHPEEPRQAASRRARRPAAPLPARSEEHTSELQSLMRISYAVFCLKKKKQTNDTH